MPLLHDLARWKQSGAIDETQYETLGAIVRRDRFSIYTELKPYLGWPRHEWDPILPGLFLLAVVFGVRRWLSSAPGGHRRGVTAARLLSDRPSALTLLSAVPLGTAAHLSAPHTRAPSGFDGGRSGGGGADAGF